MSSWRMLGAIRYSPPNTSARRTARGASRATCASVTIRVPVSDANARTAVNQASLGQGLSKRSVTAVRDRSAAGAHSAHLRIRSIGVAAPVQPLTLLRDRTLAVPQNAESVGSYIAPPGPRVLVGHVDWNGRRGVFSRLHELAPGDQILIDRADGSSLRFVVAHVESYDKSGFPTGKVYGDTERPELRLITCHGDFDHAARSYTKNLVVFATLTP